MFPPSMRGPDQPLLQLARRISSADNDVAHLPQALDELTNYRLGPPWVHTWTLEAHKDLILPFDTFSLMNSRGSLCLMATDRNCERS